MRRLVTMVAKKGQEDFRRCFANGSLNTATMKKNQPPQKLKTKKYEEFVVCSLPEVRYPLTSDKLISFYSFSHTGPLNVVNTTLSLLVWVDSWVKMGGNGKKNLTFKYSCKPNIAPVCFSHKWKMYLTL